MKDQRFCIYCGQETKQRAENLRVCANGHENWINYIPGASCFILKDGKVLYGVRSIEPSIGGLNIAGGFIDLGETVEEAVIREAREEMGLEIRIVDYLGSYPSDYAGRPILNLTFIAEPIGGHLQPAEDMSGGDPVWRDIDDLPQKL